MAHRESHRSWESVVVTLSFEGTRSGVARIARISLGSTPQGLETGRDSEICRRRDPLQGNTCDRCDAQVYRALLRCYLGMNPHVAVQALSLIHI